MLKVFFDRECQRLNICFDITVPKSIYQLEGFSLLLENLRKSGETETVTNEHEELVSISCTMSTLNKFTENFLSAEGGTFQKNIFSEFLNRRHAEQKSNVDVNFHQKSFDTPERYWNFILNQGDFIDYFFNRVNWYLTPKNGIVSSFPLHVDIESASTCNMNCPMCYRSQMKDTGHMDVGLFRKIVDECADNNVFSVRLSWRGEPLTHPKIKEMVAYATKRIKNISLLTNAFYLNNDIIDCLIENKVSYISVSFDGIGKVYESIRYPARFDENFRKLVLLQDKKKNANSKFPQVRLCTIWPAINKEPEAYYHAMKEVSDYIVYNPYINFAGPVKIKQNFMCQYPWERIVIAYNGNTQCCTGWNATDIILGNAGDRFISDMWHSELMNKIRRIHSGGRRIQLKSCAMCRHGSEGNPDVNISDIIKRRF